MHTLKPAIIFLLLFALTPTVATAAAGDPVLSLEEQALNTLINQHRVTNGVPPLRVSVALTQAAKWHSTDMATKNYFSHTDSLGRTFSTRLGAFGYTYATAKGENIAAGGATAALTFAQWRTSSGHNTTMLSRSYTVIGLGRAYSAASTYKWYWTTTFGGYTDRLLGS